MQTPRRAEATPTAAPAPPPFFRYRFADVDYDESVSVLRVAGVTVVIEPRPLELLSELLRRPNEVIAREELLDALWHGRPTVDNVLANAVTKLRKALGPQGAERLINVPRVGYRLAGPIERVAVGQHAGSLPALIAGERVPGRESYRLEAPLGRGAATALVWRARDPKLHETRVFKFAADSERLTSLKREYTLYRVLRAELGERDDFARVLGVNFATAPYFLECEDGGEDLPRWADQGRHLAALDTASRVALFLQIARAVAAAHSVGVLHKDLKPANVLIAAAADGWVARLTDFGISRLLDPGRLVSLDVTAMGMTVTQGASLDSLAGTLLYMAPELLAGQSATMQSDLYALGVMLYQLLMGDFKRPMSTGWDREIDDELLREDIAAATEGKPDERLVGVAVLIERIESLERRRAHRLDQQNATDRAKALAERVERSRVRQPWIVAAFASLLVGLVFSIWFYLGERAAVLQARRETMRAQSINDFLNQDVLQSADIASVGPGRPTTMLEVINSASARAEARFHGDPLTEASVRLELGGIFHRLTSFEESEKEYRRALALLESNGVPANDKTLLLLQLKLSRLLGDVNKMAEAKKLLDVAERNAGDGLLNGTNEIAAAAANSRLQIALRDQKLAQAEDAARRLVEITDLLTPPDATAIFRARHNWAETLIRIGNYAAAERVLDGMLTVPAAEQIVGEVLFARSRIEHARSRIALHKTEGAEVELLRARDTLLRKLGPYELHVGVASTELASLYESLAEWPKAAAAYAAAKTVLEKKLGGEHPSVRITELNAVLIELNAGGNGQALKELERLRPWFVKNMGPADSPIVQSLDFSRSRALTGLHRFPEASEILQTLHADVIMQSNPGEDWPWKLQAEKARADAGLGHVAEALSMLRPAVDQMIRLQTPEWELSLYRTTLENLTRSICSTGSKTAANAPRCRQAS